MTGGSKSFLVERLTTHAVGDNVRLLGLRRGVVE